MTDGPTQTDASRTDASTPTDAADPTNDAEPEAAPELQELAGRLCDMARAGRGDQLVAYVDAGVPVDLRTGTGDSLLMLAAYHGHADVVGALAARGATVDLCNDRGQSPLAGAVFKGHDDVIDVLLDHGADPAAGTPTPLDTARMFERHDLLQRFAGTAGGHDRPDT